ncbi:hypothetical protein [Endothiovibrio diazotrophicus]
MPALTEGGAAPAPLRFFLGGRDLEMVAITELLARHAPGRYHDRGLGWGARASAYRKEIERALAAGETPVLIELEEDLGLDPQRIVIIDHHGERSGAQRPTSLEQVFVLLGLPAAAWSRRLALIAANDRGYLPAMAELGASREEMAEIRAAERAAQGIGAEEEEAAERAAVAIEMHAGGRLTRAELPHGRCAPLTDRLAPELGGPGYRNLLVVSPGEVNLFGEGGLILAAAERFPGGWYGGSLPERGYWGAPRTVLPVDFEDKLTELVEALP